MLIKMTAEREFQTIFKKVRDLMGKFKVQFDVLVWFKV
jgi:hypothetical protein